MHRFTIALLVAFGLCATARGQEATLKVGDPAPALAPAKWIKGEPVKQFEKGKLYVVEFWATWCGPCRVSIPHLSKLQEQYKDITFIGQDCWEDDQSAVAPFVEKIGEKMNYRVALDDMAQSARGKMADTWMAAAGQNGIPTAFVVGKDTTIAWIGHPMELDDVLKQIVAGTFDARKVAAAREARAAVEQKLDAAMRGGGPEKALQVIEEAIKTNPEMAQELSGVKFRLLIAARKFVQATDLAKELSESSKDDADVLNELAWAMVDPDVKFENPDLALAEKMAARANDLTKGENAGILDTLARVFFNQGQVDKAIELQGQAVAKADAGAPRNELQKTLDQYKSKASRPAAR